MFLERARNTHLAECRVRDQRLRGRRAVFEAAMTLFALQGYSATALTQIGDAVGLRPGSLYNHIDSKQELLLRVATEAFTVLRRETFTAMCRPRPPVEQLRAIAFCLAHAHASNPWQMLVLDQDLSCVEGPLPVRVRALRKDLRRAAVEAILRGEAEGHFDAVPTEPVADLLLGAGAQVARRAISGPAVEPEAVAFDHADLALRLVACSP